MTTPHYDTGAELELRDYFAVIRRRKLIIIAVTLVVVAAAVVYSLLQTPIYQATTQVLIQPTASESVLNDTQQQNPLLIQQQIQTEIQVIESRSIRDAVTAELGSLPEVNVASLADTSVLTISVDDADATAAAEQANGYARVYVAERRRTTGEDLLGAAGDLQNEIDQIDVRIAEADQRVVELNAQIMNAGPEAVVDLTAQRDAAQATADGLRRSSDGRRLTIQEQVDRLQLEATLNQTRGPQIVSQAEAPSSPISPKPVRNAMVALVLGLLLGIGAAFVREYLDDTVRSKEDLENVTAGLSTLGLVPSVDGWRDRKEAIIDSLDHPTGPAAEAYRSIRTSLQFLGIDRDLRSILFTSSGPGEGKSTTSANLAVALASSGNKVLLIDCDLRRPRTHQFFDLDNAEGFTSVLLGRKTIDEVIERAPDVPRLWVLTSGPLPPAPAELLARPAVKDFFSSTHKHFDYVIVDSPPVLPVADSIIMAAYVDSVVLVANAKTTAKRSLHRAVEVLQQVDAPIAGTVLNGIAPGDSYIYGGYGYGAASDAAKA